jgi:quinol monooxygenase YgiN
MPLSNAAFLRAKPGKRTALTEGLRLLIPLTRNESGCLDYQIHQSTSDPDNFFIYEHWKSEESFDFHMQTQYVVEFLSRQEDLVEGDINILPYQRF